MRNRSCQAKALASGGFNLRQGLGSAGCRRRRHVARRRTEISQLRSGWAGCEKYFVPDGTVESPAKHPASLQDALIFMDVFQPRCGWLISGCPFGTK